MYSLSITSPGHCAQLRPNAVNKLLPYECTLRTPTLCTTGVTLRVTWILPTHCSLWRSIVWFWVMVVSTSGPNARTHSTKRLSTISLPSSAERYTRIHSSAGVLSTTASPASSTANTTAAAAAAATSYVSRSLISKFTMATILHGAYSQISQPNRNPVLHCHSSTTVHSCTYSYELSMNSYLPVKLNLVTDVFAPISYPFFVCRTLSYVIISQNVRLCRR